MQIVATPDVNSQLESLTINKKPLEGNKVTLTADLEVNAAFKPKEGALVSIDKMWRTALSYYIRKTAV